MNDEVLFLDTNVLVYLFDFDEPDKKMIAEGIFSDHLEIRFSTQVLQEFYVTVTRKLGRPMPPEQALIAVEHFQRSWQSGLDTPDDESRVSTGGSHPRT